MGNTPSSTSSRTHDETVDYGALVPQGVYTGPRDWSHAAVAQSIIERRLAPFYRPLEDYEEGWTDEQILSARKEPPPPPAQDEEDGNGSAAGSSHGHAAQGQAQGGGGSHIGLGFGHGHAGQGSSLGGRHHGKKASTTGKGKDRDTAAAAAAQAALNEASLYRGAAECPICFLYYPPNINYSRCCSQPICTECFVQIKRAEPDAQHLESEPAACPYCVRSDFGVVYKPPPWRAGIGSDGHLPPSPGAVQAPVSPPAEIKRRQSFGANDPQVVTTDQIRPDWEAKVAAVKAAVARRAARRIIMRQVGDRLIPVGISSGRVQIMPEEAGAAGATGQPEDRRQRRRDRDISRMLGIPGFNSGDYPGGVIATQDLEELMIAEAMRQSVIEEEERQRKEREKEAKEKKKGGNSTPTTTDTTAAGPSTSTTTGPIEGLPASAPHSTMHLPAVQGSSLLPPPGPGPETRGRQASGHQASTSLSNSNSLAPNTGSGDSTPTTSSSRARSQPPFSALSAALRGAAHAASAIGVPGAHKKRERDLTSTASSSQSNINAKERQSSSGPSSARPSLSAQGSGGSGTNAPPAPTPQRTSPPAPAPVLVPTSQADATASSRVLDLETTANTNTTTAAEPSASSAPPPASSPSTTSGPVSMLSVSIPPESGPQSAITPASSSAAPISSVSSAPDVPDTAAMGLFSPRPELGTNDSFASSIASDASDATVMYDVLGSDEEDEDDGEEEEGLLRGEAPLPVATPGIEPETPGLGGDEAHAGGILGAK